MDILDVLAICAGNAIGVLLVHGAGRLWRRWSARSRRLLATKTSRR